MTNQERRTIEADLWSCNNIGEVFHYLSNYFDLFSKPMPGLYKGMIIAGILAAIQWIQPNKKKKDGNI
jgi:hypothetical protein